MEQGKPLVEAQGEVIKGASILRYYAEEGERVYGRIIANEESDIESMVIYQPIGVAAAISPWNYPIELLAWKVGGALAAGCTLVAKLPSETPLSPLAFIRCLADAGIPDGVLNAVTGPGSVIGVMLTSSPVVKKVAFTGSTEVGREVLKSSVGTLKKVSLELGGSLPMIICKDCNLDAAVSGAVRRSFRNMGQICIAINRIYVVREIYDDFIERFAQATKRLVIGNGLTDKCDLGPMCTLSGIKKTISHIQDAVGKGAKVVCGGKRPDGPKFEKGYFFEPTILRDVDHSMLVMREETFGPLVGVMPFDTLDEAVKLANDTQYGLAAIVFTQDINTARCLCRDIEAGNVAVNNVDAGVINAPYGGWKDSGFGVEHGSEGLYEYLHIKHIRIRYL
jgi:succinate-semialdehyde dehydrogenase/glutarate-semialdehyde dehydrogenase